MIETTVKEVYTVTEEKQLSDKTPEEHYRDQVSFLIFQCCQFFKSFFQVSYSYTQLTFYF